MNATMKPLTNPRSRGRPVRSPEQVNEMKARVVERAYSIFMREGFEAISMRYLAAELGCTVMTVYKHFPRKIDILQALWARVFGDLFDGLERSIAAGGDPVERLNALALGYVQFWLERRDHYFLVFMSSNVDQADVSIFVQNDELLARFDIFRQAIAAASAPDFNEDALALKVELLLCALNGTAQNLITISGYPWSRPEALVQAAVRAVTSNVE